MASPQHARRDWRAEPRSTLDPAIAFTRPLFTARPDLIRRDDALKRLVAKYRDKPFDWKARRTCVNLLRSHLVQMGHRPPRLPYIASPIGAIRALRERGWRDVTEMLDALLPRVVPAALLPGDIAAVTSDDGLGAIFVAGDRGRYWGWREDLPVLTALEIAPAQLAGAWRA
jgi:hypothetical protein